MPLFHAIVSSSLDSQRCRRNLFSQTHACSCVSPCVPSPSKSATSDALLRVAISALALTVLRPQADIKGTAAQSFCITNYLDPANLQLAGLPGVNGSLTCDFPMQVASSCKHE